MCFLFLQESNTDQTNNHEIKTQSLQDLPSSSGENNEQGRTYRPGLLWRISFWLFVSTTAIIAPKFIAKKAKVRGRSFFPEISERTLPAVILEKGQRPLRRDEPSLVDHLLESVFDRMDGWTFQGWLFLWDCSRKFFYYSFKIQHFFWLHVGKTKQAVKLGTCGSSMSECWVWVQTFAGHQ